MWLIDKLAFMGSPANAFSAVEIVTVLIVSTILCFIAAKVYKETHSGISYSNHFVQTIVIFGVIVSMIMLIIGSNIARAFTLMGALSIIRFRTAIKDAKDLGFIFFVMAIGMGVGTKFYGLSIIMTIFVSSLLIFMKKINFGGKKTEDEILKITVPANINFEEKIEPVLKRWFDSYHLINIEGAGQGLSELVYLVRFGKRVKNRSFLLGKIKEINEGRPVYIFGTDHLIY